MVIIYKIILQCQNKIFVNNEYYSKIIGFLDYIAKAEYCFIEWPEQVIDVFSNDYHLFEFKIVEETIRKIIFK